MNPEEKQSSSQPNSVTSNPTLTTTPTSTEPVAGIAPHVVSLDAPMNPPGEPIAAPAVPASAIPEELPATPEAPAPTPTSEPEKTHAPIVHSYAEDLAQAMQATDASTVQDLLALAREKETAIAINEHEKKTSWLFIAGAVICFLVSGGMLYYVWNQYELSKPVSLTRTAATVTFPQLPLMEANKTDIREVVSYLKTKAPVELRKPAIVPIVTGTEPLEPIAFMQFIEGELPPVILQQVTSIRIGVVATGTEAIPFLVFGTNDRDKLTSAFLAGEGELLRATYRALGVSIAENPTILETPFVGDNISNIPVRKLLDPATKELVALYGFSGDHLLVLTTNQSAFQDIYLHNLSQY